jgi:hypothetical protein
LRYPSGSMGSSPLLVSEVPVDIGEERPAIVIEPVEDPIRRPAEKPVPSEPEKVEIPA